MNKDLKQHGSMKERGSIKWTSLMLPEHIAQLRDWQEEDGRVERPELTEWDLVALQEELELVSKRKCQTHIKTWRDGRIIHNRGTIEKIDVHNKAIILAEPFGDLKIPIDDIISVQSVESSRRE
ncbi:YolD-like family protein [Sporosarcina sp. Te-1]|uniref:YolD-like family protein n=1 Tax=Sporosarcina sp. Te-1 TaxID=2818390 RepID=UPI001A9D5E63|nr:YolD-like family protein [Sporosarcina sp. Te-1]QTD41403.1 YolD-like family protein [Sporosarcina sp. Te-1]